MTAVYTFDKENHYHYISGIHVPGPTTVLKAMGFIDTQWFSEDACYRGNYVHAACHLINQCKLSGQGSLDWDNIKPEFLGYIRAYEKAVKELEIKVKESEQPVYSTLWMTAGIPDIVTEELFIWDIKTSKQKQAWWVLQTGGYKPMYEELHKVKVSGRGTLQLFEDGTYAKDEHKDKSDERHWWNNVTLYKLKQKMKIIKLEEADLND